MAWYKMAANYEVQLQLLFCLQHQYKHHDDKIEQQILNNSLDEIDKAFSYGKLKWWKIIGGEFTILPLSIRDRILDIAKNIIHIFILQQMEAT